MELTSLLQSLEPDELRFIAERDYGQDVERHLLALQAVVTQGGTFPQGEYWYPYEVVELGAHALETGHEREFAACTLLVLRAIADGFDTSTDLESKLADRAADYGKLQPELRSAVLAAYASAGL